MSDKLAFRVIGLISLASCWLIIFGYGESSLRHVLSLQYMAIWLLCWTLGKPKNGS